MHVTEDSWRKSANESPDVVIPPRNVLLDAFQEVMALAAKGELRIDTERVSLADIENAWQRDSPGRRWVIITRWPD